MVIAYPDVYTCLYVLRLPEPRVHVTAGDRVSALDYRDVAGALEHPRPDVYVAVGADGFPAELIAR
jgi:hypothetical protein